jgi:hypothetical protein
MPSARYWADKRYDAKRARDPDRLFVRSWQWRSMVRPAQLEREPLCRRCKRPATQVDHVLKPAGDPRLQGIPGNLQSLCASCHAIKTRDESRGKTHCRHGHAYEGNTVIEGDGGRRCKTCRTLKSKRRNERRRKQHKAPLTGYLCC